MPAGVVPWKVDPVCRVSSEAGVNANAVDIYLKEGISDIFQGYFFRKLSYINCSYIRIFILLTEWREILKVFTVYKIAYMKHHKDLSSLNKRYIHISQCL